MGTVIWASDFQLSEIYYAPWFSSKPLLLYSVNITISLLYLVISEVAMGLTYSCGLPCSLMPGFNTLDSLHFVMPWPPRITSGSATIIRHIIWNSDKYWIVNFMHLRQALYHQANFAIFMSQFKAMYLIIYLSLSSLLH